MSQRIQEIKSFGKECFGNPEELSAAAVVFIHSDHTKFTPQTYLQAFNWARKASELGDVCHKRYIANSIRKYFDFLHLNQADFSVGHLVLSNGCPCFSIRKGVKGQSLEKQLACDPPGRSRNGNACTFQACANDPLALPRNSIPGIW